MDKNSFVLYTSYQDHVSLLTMEQRGVLLTAIMNYAAGQDLPEMDGMTQMAFSFIRSDLDRNDEKYNRVCEARREAGKKGGRPKANGFSEKAKKANGFSEKQTKAKKPDNDDEDEYEDDVKETLSKESEKKSKRFLPPTSEQVKEYCSEKGYQVDAERFVDFYTSKGWVVGKTPMRDWKAAVRTWASSEKTAKGSRQEVTARPPAGRFANFEQRQYDMNALERALVNRGMG